MGEEIGFREIRFNNPQLNSIKEIEYNTKIIHKCEVCGQTFRNMTQFTSHFTKKKCGNLIKHSSITYKLINIALYGKRVKSNKWIEVYLSIEELDFEID